MKIKHEKTQIYYDEEGDMLEIIIGKPTISYMKNLGGEMFVRIDEKTGKTKGFLILGFKKRCEKNAVNIPLPTNLELTA